MLALFDARLQQIEDYLHIRTAPQAEDELQAEPEPADTGGQRENNGGLEAKIGVYGLAWVGSAVMLLGIAYLMTYAFNTGHSWLSTCIGFAAAAVFFILAGRWQATLPHLASLLVVASYFLLFYTMLRLHFFTPEPLIGNRGLAVVLLLAVLSIELFDALRQASERLAGAVLLLGFAAAVIFDSTHLTLSIFTLLVALSAGFAVLRGWTRQLFFVLPLTYLLHLLWLLNNPLMGNPVGAVAEHQNNLLYLFAYAVLFSLPTLQRDAYERSQGVVAALAFLNGAAFAFVGLLVVLTFFQHEFTGIALAAAAVFLLFSLLQWRLVHQPLVPSLSACFGFLFLSAAVFGYTEVPAAYFWLSLQSLLVVSMALWFRSRLIVVVNTFIYLILLLAYWLTGDQAGWVTLTFALTALASARIMNWKKQRLTLQTELLRNLYLLAAFFTVLSGLYNSVPPHFVTLSWTLAAAAYFGISLLLNNIKYRWMALLTVLAAVLYLFVVDLARLEAGYRVIAFMVLGVILLAGSLFYAKFRHRLKF